VLKGLPSNNDDSWTKAFCVSAPPRKQEDEAIKAAEIERANWAAKKNHSVLLLSTAAVFENLSNIWPFVPGTGVCHVFPICVSLAIPCHSNLQ